MSFKNESATSESVAKTKKPFVDVKVTTPEILFTKKLEDMLVNRKETVKWLETKWMKFERENPWTLQFKNTLNGILTSQKQLCLRKSGVQNSKKGHGGKEKGHAFTFTISSPKHPRKFQKPSDTNCHKVTNIPD